MTRLIDRLDDQLALAGHEAQLLASVRQLCRARIAPRAAALDREARFPAENIEDINALGLNAMFIPEAYGGAPVSYLAYLAVAREIAAACASTGVVWSTNFHAMGPVVDHGPAELKARILPRLAEGALAALAITEPEAGSDATGMRTTFTLVGDEIVVEGEKCFITTGDVADLILLFGKWAGVSDPRAAIACLVVERPAEGLAVERLEDKMGLRASSTAALRFDGLRVPAANLVAGPGEGLRLLLAALNKSRPSIAAHALGIARAAFEDAVAYVNQRRQSGRRIVEFQGVQFLLADLASELALCETYLAQVGRSIDAGRTDIGVEASIAKLRASDLAMRMTTEAVQLFGGYGYIKGNRVERLMRDAKITQIWEGTNQVHRQLIGRSLVER